MDKESWRMYHGGGVIEEESWRGNLGSVIMEASRLWEAFGNSQESPRGTQKAPRRLPRGSQEAPRTPRRLPEGSQEAPRRHPGGSRGNQASKRPLRESRAILYQFFTAFLTKAVFLYHFYEGDLNLR